MEIVSQSPMVSLSTRLTIKDAMDSCHETCDKYPGIYLTEDLLRRSLVPCSQWHSPVRCDPSSVHLAGAEDFGART
jgi:hypothetical protein